MTIFNLMKITKKLSKRVENTVGKGEIAHYKQVLLFPKSFKKTCTEDTLKQGLVWERVNTSLQSFTLLNYIFNNFVSSLKKFQLHKQFVILK